MQCSDWRLSSQSAQCLYAWAYGCGKLMVCCAVIHTQHMSLWNNWIISDGWQSKFKNKWVKWIMSLTKVLIYDKLPGRLQRALAPTVRVWRSYTVLPNDIHSIDVLLVVKSARCLIHHSNCSSIWCKVDIKFCTPLWKLQIFVMLKKETKMNHVGSFSTFYCGYSKPRNSSKWQKETIEEIKERKRLAITQ